MFIDLPFYVSAVKKRFKKRKEISLWYLANVRDSPSLDKEIYFYLLKKEMPCVQRDLCACYGRPGTRRCNGLQNASAMGLLWQPSRVRAWSKPSAKSGSTGFRSKTLLAALPSACSVEHPRTPLASFLWLLCVLYLEELLLHKIWSPVCPWGASDLAKKTSKI